MALVFSFSIWSMQPWIEIQFVCILFWFDGSEKIQSINIMYILQLVELNFLILVIRYQFMWNADTKQSVCISIRRWNGIIWKVFFSINVKYFPTHLTVRGFYAKRKISAKFNQYCRFLQRLNQCGMGQISFGRHQRQLKEGKVGEKRR